MADFRDRALTDADKAVLKQIFNGGDWYSKPALYKSLSERFQLRVIKIKRWFRSERYNTRKALNEQAALTAHHQGRNFEFGDPNPMGFPSKVAPSSCNASRSKVADNFEFRDPKPMGSTSKGASSSDNASTSKVENKQEDVDLELRLYTYKDEKEVDLELRL
ncbi:hypothetical protein MKW98_021964 [Papaver atlanticum]|uniref:Homeobox domain-containing protein n=1 Tax=Papaver atlanticum TaxID=357466 RepID=A0AAD4XZY9_9MAGN|nr:hypothetical protein MKW98_021964 [Papaver atlanticum]